MAKVAPETAPVIPRPPLTVRCLARRSYMVFDAAGAAVSQEYWTKADAEAAKDRLNRAAQMKNRPCICCRKNFLSEGAHNRMCSACRHGNSELHQEVRPYITRGP